MASKYRIGTTIQVDVSLQNLTSDSLQMYVRSDFGVTKMSNVKVTAPGGVPTAISGKFEKASQRFTGKYDVIIESPTQRLCIDNAFELVKHTSEADSATESQTITFDATFLTSASSVSGYEEWKTTHEGTVEDYWKWVRDEERFTALEQKVEVNTNAIATETERAKAAEKANADNISKNATAIDDETKRAEAAEKGITDSLAAEVERATAAEEGIRDFVLEEQDARIGNDNKLSQEIRDEADTRAATDEELRGMIDEEKTRAEEIEGALQSGLEKETDERNTTDEALREAIQSETKARESDIERLSQAIWPLEVSLSASPQVSEVGISASIRLFWTVKRQGNPVTPESQILDGESVTGNNITKTHTATSEETLEFNYSATFEKMTKSAKANVKFVYASYFGVVPSDWQQTATNVLKLEKRIQGSRSLTKEGLQFTNSKICYCYPSSFGEMTSIKDGNGYEVLSSYIKSELQINGVGYLCYLLTNSVSADNITQIYK